MPGHISIPKCEETPPSLPQWATRGQRRRLSARVPHPKGEREEKKSEDGRRRRRRRRRRNNQSSCGGGGGGGDSFDNVGRMFTNTAGGGGSLHRVAIHSRRQKWPKFRHENWPEVRGYRKNLPIVNVFALLNKKRNLKVKTSSKSDPKNSANLLNCHPEHLPSQAPRLSFEMFRHSEGCNCCCPTGSNRNFLL